MAKIWTVLEKVSRCAHTSTLYDRNLYSQNRIHLADEGHPDIKRRLRYDTTKLEVIGQVVVLASWYAVQKSLVRVVRMRLVAWWRLRVRRRRLVERVPLGDVLIFRTGHDS